MLEDLKALTKQEMDLLTSQFKDKEIAEKIGGVSKVNVGYYRRKLGVKSYGEKNGIEIGIKGQTNPCSRKHTFNERFFQVIDSEIKAYALGLLITDGHIPTDLYRARFSITESDSYVLKQIAEAIGFTGEFLVKPPRKGNYQVKNMIDFNLNSTILVQDLLVLGLTNSKDTLLELPKVPFNLQHHFFRGMFDGDGYLPTRKTFISGGFKASLSGRCELLYKVNKMLEAHNLKPMKISIMKSIYQGHWGITGLDVFKWSYGCNPTIVLHRKLKRYNDIDALTSI